MRWFIFLILFSSFVYAVEIEFNQDNYASFETVLVKMNFTEDLVGSLMPSNVYLSDVAIIGKKVVKIDDMYYVYFYLPYVDKGSYKFQMKDLLVREEGSLVKKNFDKTLNIVERGSISLRPGFFYFDLGSNDKPQLGFDITNKGNLLDFGLSTESGFLVLDEKSFKLNPGNEKRVTVKTNFEDINDTYLVGSFDVNYGGFIYKVPVIIKRNIPVVIIEQNETIVGNETVEPIVIPISGNALVFDVLKNGGTKIDLVLAKDESKSGDMYFRNDFTEKLSNVTFELKDLNGIVTYRYSGDGILDPKEVESVYLDINPKKDLNKDYQGSLIVSASGVKTELPIIIKLRQEEVKSVVNETQKVPIVTNPVEEKTSKAWIVFVVLGLFIVVFFVMYFKGRRDRKDFTRFVEKISSGK